MPTAPTHPYKLAYEIRGPAHAPPLLLVMGLGMPLTFWPDPFVDGLVASGFRVLTYDNRDSGWSERHPDVPLPNIPLAIVRALLGFRVRAPYTLDDMADDGASLLDALGIASAHVVGVSMGGMIAQGIAARHPARVTTLTSLMASSGNRRVSLGKLSALKAILRRPADPHDPEVVTRHLVRMFRVIGSPRYPASDAQLREQCERVARRGYDPAAMARQLAAILASGDRRADLAGIRAPTLVIHGSDDPLMPVAAGRDTAENVPGARLLEIDGMGHDLPPALIPALVSAIAEHCHAAEARVPDDELVLRRVGY